MQSVSMILSLAFLIIASSCMNETERRKSIVTNFSNLLDVESASWEILKERGKYDSNRVADSEKIVLVDITLVLKKGQTNAEFIYDFESGKCPLHIKTPKNDKIYPYDDVLLPLWYIGGSGSITTKFDTTNTKHHFIFKFALPKEINLNDCELILE